MSRGLSWMSRLAVGGLLFVAAPLLLAAPVVAEQPGEVLAEAASFYSSLSMRTPVAPIVDPLATNTLELDDVPVGAVGQSEHKRGYLALDLPADATTAEIGLRLSEDAGATFGLPGPILACAVVEEGLWDRGGPIADAPEVDCGDTPLEGEPVDDVRGTGDPGYRWDITPIVQRWHAGEPQLGIAIVADVTEPQPLYQVVFSVDFFEVIGSSDGGAAVEPPAPAGDVAAPAPPADVTPAPADPFPRVGGSSPLDAPSVPVPDQQPLAAEPEPEQPTAAAPEAAMVPLAPIPVRPVMWLLVPLGVGTLLLSGRGLAAAGEPASTLDQLLSR